MTVDEMMFILEDAKRRHGGDTPVMIGEETVRQTELVMYGVKTQRSPLFFGEVKSYSECDGTECEDWRGNIWCNAGHVMGLSVRT